MVVLLSKLFNLFKRKRYSENVGQEVLRIVVQQRQKGIDKYGHDIDGNKNDDVIYWIEHHQQELVDALFYITRLKQELQKKSK